MATEGSAMPAQSIQTCYAMAGQHEEALNLLDTLQERAQCEHIDPLNFAYIYTGLGEKDHAIAWLHKAYEERSSWHLMRIKVAPAFDNLHSVPRFTELLKKRWGPTD